MLLEHLLGWWASRQDAYRFGSSGPGTSPCPLGMGSLDGIFYAFVTGKRIVLFHGFQKKIQKTPRREIIRVSLYLSRYEMMKGDQN